MCSIITKIFRITSIVMFYGNDILVYYIMSTSAPVKEWLTTGKQILEKL